MRTTRRSAASISLLLAFTAATVPSETVLAQRLALPTEDQSGAQTIVRSILDSREAVQSGICIVHEERKYRAPVKCEHRFVFDYSKELVRYERKHEVEGETILIGTPHDTFVYVPGGGNIDRHASRAVPIICRAMPFDLRMIGITGSGSFDSPAGFPSVRRRLLSKKAAANGQVIEIKSPATPYKQRDGRTVYVRTREVFHLDKSRTDEVSGYELFFNASFDKNDTSLSTEVLDQGTTTTWKRLGNALVPTECTMISHPRSKSPSRTKMTFDWKSLNAPVDIRAFDIESLGAPPGTPILNHQSGKPVEQGRIGDKRKAPNL